VASILDELSDERIRVLLPPSLSLNSFHYINEGMLWLRMGEERFIYNIFDDLMFPFDYDDHDEYGVERLLSYVNGLMRVTKDNKIGLLDKNGSFVVPMEYDDVGNFSDGMAWVRMGDQYGFVDESGDLVIPIMLDTHRIETPGVGAFNWSIQNFSEGRAAVIIDGKCGFIDKTGELVIPAIYCADFYDGEWGAYMPRFSNGLARLRMEKHGDGGWGYIDRYGNTVVPFEYDIAGCRYTGNYTEGLIVVSKDGSWGFLDTDGNVAIPLVYGGAMHFSQGLAAVKAPDTEYYDPATYWGFIDTTGTLVIPYEFEIGEPWSGYSRFDKAHDFLQIYGGWDGGRFTHQGVINRSGDIILPTEYKKISFLPNNLIYAEKDDESFLFDKDGNTVTPFGENWHIKIEDSWWQTTEGHLFSAYYDPTHWVFIDTTGVLVIPSDFEIGVRWSGYSHFFHEHDFLMIFNGWDGSRFRQQGVINRSGDIILPTEYRRIRFLPNNLICAEKDDKPFFFDKDGNMAASFDENWHIKIEDSWWRQITDSRLFSATNETSKHGIMDIDGNIIVPFIMDNAQSLDRQRQLWMIREGNYWGILQIMDAAPEEDNQ
jgi:hypothetical protein